MMRHRRNALEAEDSYSDEDDDAFAALSRKAKRPKIAVSNRQSNTTGSKSSDINSNSNETKDPPTTKVSVTTSSMKRHHGALTDARKAKMDALLVELAEESKPKAKQQQHPSQRQQQQQVRGSFVQPGEEHITTNLFVGNLAPSITEEQLSELFSQFGDLHSVKIMWPRTPEEKSRNRHSGFVCFVNRPDAEDALAECDETDPFNVGRRIMVRWGRHVKKDAAPPPAVRRHCAANTSNNTNNNTSNAAVAHQLRQSFNNTNDYDHRPRIQVVPPRDPLRLRFITTVASFVAKDGSQLEKQLPHRDAQFSFLHSQDPDHVFYRWRVYSFIQGDSHFVWRTEPFVMLEPGGCLWIPPPVDPHAARRERQQQEEKAAEIRRLKEQRRMQPQRHHPAAQTGRSLERQRRGADERLVLSREEVAEFDRLFRHELCASRGAICRAMAFCFEKSACWTQICEMLRELLVDDRAPKKSSEFVVETKIAQLFLLSDVLFNSQQPGVKNAFRYRDAIEKMAPDVFGSFGSRSQHLGRWTRNKLATAVSAVLGAWTNWSVYNPAFLDELHARFEGREVAPAVVVVKKEELPAVKEEGKEEAKAEIKQEHDDVVRKTPQGDWAVVDEKNAEEQEQHSESTDVKQVKRNEDATAADGETPEDADGEPLDDDEDADGEPLEEDDDADADADGEPLDEEDDDADGEPLDDDDDDGEPLEEE